MSETKAELERQRRELNERISKIENDEFVEKYGYLAGKYFKNDAGNGYVKHVAVTGLNAEDARFQVVEFATDDRGSAWVSVCERYVLDPADEISYMEFHQATRSFLMRVEDLVGKSIKEEA